MSSRATPATVAATRSKIPFTLHPYQTGSVAGSSRSLPSTPAGGATSYGVAVADALGVPHERVFKTLVAEVDRRLTVAVVPVAASLDLKALAAAMGGKRAAMAEPAGAERATGYVRGGISPLGQRRRLPTVIDASSSGFPTIYVSAGRRGLEIELATVDLIRLTEARVGPIARL